MLSQRFMTLTWQLSSKWRCTLTARTVDHPSLMPVNTLLLTVSTLSALDVHSTSLTVTESGVNTGRSSRRSPTMM